MGEIDKAASALGRAIRDEVRTAVREEMETLAAVVLNGMDEKLDQKLHAVTPGVIKEINDHTDAVHTQLRADLRDQGLAISPVARTKG